MKAKKIIKRRQGQKTLQIVINLTPIEQRALTRLKKVNLMQGNLAVVAHWMVLYVLNCDTGFMDWINRVVRYCDAEDIDEIKWIEGNLKARRDYARTKLPAH